MNTPHPKIPGPLPKIPPQQPPPPAGGMHGNPVGGPKPGMGMPPQGVHGIPGASQRPQPKPAHPPDELISLTIPRQAFEQVFQQLLVLTKMMALAGQKASQDVQGGAGPGIPGGGGPSPAVMGLAQKIGMGPGGPPPGAGGPPMPPPQGPPPGP